MPSLFKNGSTASSAEQTFGDLPGRIVVLTEKSPGDVKPSPAARLPGLDEIAVANWRDSNFGIRTAESLESIFRTFL
eukprot:2536819-Amphidinium_carterae.1